MKNYFDTLSPEEQHLEQVCSNLQRTFSSYVRTSVLKIEPGGKLKIWCCNKTYTVLIVPKDSPTQDRPGFDLVADDMLTVVDFFTKKTNEFLRAIA